VNLLLASINPVNGIAVIAKDKKIPSSGVKKDLVHRVKMHQDSISRQRGGLGEGGMSSNRIVGGESCGEGGGEGGGSNTGPRSLLWTLEVGLFYSILGLFNSARQ
jgi:hypothetical protein